MSTYYRGVNDQVFHIRVVDKVLMHPFPDTLLTPADKSLIDAVPLAVLGWQQPTGSSTASYPKYGFDEAAAFGLLSNIYIWALIKEAVNL